MNDELTLQRRDETAIVTLCRPHRANALSRSLVAQLGHLGTVLCGDPSLRLIVLTGHGSRAFCSGADLVERAIMSDEQIREMLLAYRTELGWIDPCPIPIVAALNGVALGGGLELALMCDLRIAAAHAEMGLPETSLAIIPGAGGTQRLPQIIGEGRAKELVLLGSRVSAAEALALGLVNRVVPPEANLLEETLAWLEPIRHGAPLAMRAALRAIDESRKHSLADGLEAELAAYETCLTSEDRREALAARKDKRRPRYQGR